MNGMEQIVRPLPFVSLARYLRLTFRSTGRRALSLSESSPVTLPSSPLTLSTSTLDSLSPREFSSP